MKFVTSRGTLLLGSLLLLSVFFSACAAKYQAIRPGEISFSEPDFEDDVQISFRQGVLMLSGNEKMSNRELKGDLQLLAVNVRNTSDRTINFIEDVKLYADDQMILPLDQKIVHTALKQRAPLYFLYFLLFGYLEFCNGSDCTNIPVPIGVPIGLLNYNKANQANDAFREELKRYDLLNMSIEPGQEVFGLIGIPKLEGAKLRFEVR